MANVYVYSGAGGTNDGSSWANAYTTLVSAAAAKAAGDVFWVAHDHNETAAAAKSLSFTGTESNSNKVFCVNRAGSVPPVAADLATTGIIDTTGASAITMSGAVSECYGLTFRAGSGASTANINVSTSLQRSWKFMNCTFHLNNTSATSRCTFGNPGVMLILENCQVRFGAAGQTIAAGSRTLIRGNTLPFLHASSTVPTNLINPSTSSPQILLDGVDLSTMTSGNICNLTAALHTNCIIKDCKMNSGATAAGAVSSGSGGSVVTLVRSDSADTNYRWEQYANTGSIVADTGSNARTGGATDGTTLFAWKMTTISPTIPVMPLECPPIVVWNETIGSAITVTIHGYWATTPAVPTNQDVWIDVSYLGTSGFPMASTATSRPGPTTLTAASSLAAGSGWSGAGASWKMAVTITPQEKGPITIYVRLLKISTTVWIDPRPVIT